MLVTGTVDGPTLMPWEVVTATAIRTLVATTGGKHHSWHEPVMQDRFFCDFDAYGQLVAFNRRIEVVKKGDVGSDFVKSWPLEVINPCTLINA